MSRAFKLRRFEIGTILQYIPDPFIVNLICSTRRENIQNRQIHQKIAQWSGIQNAGIENGDFTFHLIAESEFLRLRRQFIQSLQSLRVDLFLVGFQIREKHAPVRSDLAKWNFAFFQQSD